MSSGFDFLTRFYSVLVAAARRGVDHVIVSIDTTGVQQFPMSIRMITGPAATMGKLMLPSHAPVMLIKATIYHNVADAIDCEGTASDKYVGIASLTFDFRGYIPDYIPPIIRIIVRRHWQVVVH